MVQSVDSKKLANLLNKSSNGSLRIYIQVNISQEECRWLPSLILAKSGVTSESCSELVHHVVNECKQLQLEGLMCIGDRSELRPNPDFVVSWRCDCDYKYFDSR